MKAYIKSQILISIIYEDSITEHKAIIVNQKFLKNFIKIKLTIIILITITAVERKTNEVVGFSLFFIVI